MTIGNGIGTVSRLLALHASVVFLAKLGQKVFQIECTLVFAFFGSLVFNTCVLSTIINFLKKPLYKHQIDSIQEIINEPYALAGDEFALEHLREQNEVFDLEKENSMCSLFFISRL